MLGWSIEGRGDQSPYKKIENQNVGANLCVHPYLENQPR
jgi:hypothetical protein